MKNNLEQFIMDIIKIDPKTEGEFESVRRKLSSKYQISLPSNINLLKSYHKLLKSKRIKRQEILEQILRKAKVRTLSGVAIVTSLAKPYDCPGKCVYCPTEARMPKSYLASEPAAARALSLEFEPYRQMTKRIEMLEINGHPTDKIEFIIKGGTWNAYPIKYQYWFVLESFKACNNLSRKKKKRKLKYSNKLTLDKLQNELSKEQSYNERCRHRIIGLTLETRPDAVTTHTIFHMRNQGCTRIELGLQAPDDDILKLTGRGHTTKQFKNAMELLRNAGFKVDLHFMPDLPGSSALNDVKMYKLLFTDTAYKPDMIKIYPCTVIKTAKLYDWFKSGKYKPYGDKKLFEALIKMKSATPGYCRISRLIRDIPTDEIEAGNDITNLREELMQEMEKQGLKCKCLRCREVGHSKKKYSSIKLFADKYDTIGGTEYFISFEDLSRSIVYGFLRLRIPDKEISDTTSPLLDKLPEIKDCAFIRELHIYGQLVEIGSKKKSASQHKGLGKKLVKQAENIAKKNGFDKLAVISGVGVRDYYRKLGYRKVGTYMIKNF